MTERIHRRDCVWICLGLAAAAIAVYWPVTHFEFVSFDDPVYVTGNEVVQTGLSLGTMGWAFTTLEAQFWHPLTWLSHMVDWQIYGLKAGGHHLTNLLLHLANTLLLFGVMQRMTGAVWRSGLLAALFALHPLHVESVAWVAERKDVLSTLFWMLALWAYGRYVELKVAGCKLQVGAQRRGNTQYGTRNTSSYSRLTCRPAFCYSVSLFFFALGLMAKPMLVTLPFVLLLVDYWPLRRFELTALDTQRATLMRLVREKVPFFVLTMVASVLAFQAQKNAGELLSMDQLPMGVRIGNALVSYVRYLGKALWPADLAVHYPHPGQWPVWSVVGALLLLAGVTLVVILARVQRPYLVVGWFWFVGTLVPVIGLVQVGGHAMADRYTYVPLIGIFILTVWGVAEAVATRRYGNWALAALGAAAVIGCMGCSRLQLEHWRNSLALFEHALAVAPNNALVRNNLGVTLLRMGKSAEAVDHFQEALRIKADYADAHFNLGIALFQLGQVPAAIEQYEEALRLKPGLADAHNNLGAVLFQQGKAAEAIGHYEQALRLKPRYAEAHYNLGNAIFRQGKVAEAIDHYQQAVQIKPNYADAHRNLAVALFEQGKVPEAVGHLERALRLKPEDADAHYNLGKALLQLGRLPEAIGQYEQVLRLKPLDAQARNQLGMARFQLGEGLAARGKWEEAIVQYEQALELTTNGAVTCLDRLGVAYAEAGRFAGAVRAAQKALELAMRDGQKELGEQIGHRLESYRADRPYRGR